MRNPSSRRFQHRPDLYSSVNADSLDDPRCVRWFPRFLERVLRNEPAVLALLETNPFPETPPVFVPTQAGQIQNLILQGYDAIVINASSPDALNGAIKQACDRSLLSVYIHVS